MSYISLTSDLEIYVSSVLLPFIAFFILTVKRQTKSVVRTTNKFIICCHGHTPAVDIMGVYVRLAK